VVTDQIDRASLHPAVMAYVVGGDACDVGGRIVCELLGPHLSPTGHNVLCLFNGDGVYMHVRYHITSGCYDIVRLVQSLVEQPQTCEMPQQFQMMFIKLPLECA